MRPTHKEIVEVFREAREAITLSFKPCFSEPCNCPRCRQVQATLSKINPILKELEEV